MYNSQTPEKRVTTGGDTLAVNSIFPTVQGEGPFAGCTATFIRLAGCNLQCPLCDTEYTNRKSMGLHEIANAVDSAWAPRYKLPRLVVITGGEPFRQPIGPLCTYLLSLDYKVQIETNGTLYQEGPWGQDGMFIICSPKTGTINKKLLPFITALKYVATAESLESQADGLPENALLHPNAGGLARPPKNWKGEIYLQPVDESMIHGKRFNYKDTNFAPDEEVSLRNQKNLKAVLASCMAHDYRLCLQVHKIVGLA